MAIMETSIPPPACVPFENDALVFEKYYGDKVERDLV